MSRQYVYEQKDKVLNYTGTLDNNEDLSVKTIILSDDIIKKTIISLILDCASSYEGVQNFFESIFKMKISKATISNVINEASKRAQKFDDSVDLSEISQGANDEIFQCNKPILTGIDLKSTYIYLLEDANNRTGETWQIYMEDRKENNLDLSVSVNDGGTGLIAGVKEAFPEIEIQYDVFHYLRSLGREVQKFERKAYSLIDKEAKLEKSMNTAHPHKKTKEKYEEIPKKVNDSIKTYDLIFILYTWFRELLGFSGYTIEESTELINYIFSEMKIISPENIGLKKEITKILKNLPQLLSYLNRLKVELIKSSNELKISPTVFEKMYKQLSMKSFCTQNIEIEYELVKELMNDYDKARIEFNKALEKTKKASSLVENLNGRIRKYIDIKHIVPTNFFILMKVYFNTKRYRRSRVNERINKSPLELLTNKPQPSFFELLGY